MTQEVYQRILGRNEVKSARKHRMGKIFTFQDDNDPKHNSHVVNDWFESNHIKRLPWPA